MIADSGVLRRTSADERCGPMPLVRIIAECRRPRTDILVEAVRRISPVHINPAGPHISVVARRAAG